MQSECPYHPLQHMEPLRIHSASGIHLPMQSEYPYRPLKHMEPSRIRSASGLHLPMQSEYPYHPLTHFKPINSKMWFSNSTNPWSPRLTDLPIKDLQNEFPKRDMVIHICH